MRHDSVLFEMSFAQLKFVASILVGLKFVQLGFVELSSYVSFAEYHLSYRALLQKRPMILRNLLIVAAP